MLKNEQYVIDGKHQKPILIDSTFTSTNTKQPIIIFCHGYKGFKDWGAWHLMAKAFANAGYYFIKFNFSHNGGTIEQPIDFPDLEAFGNNNYTKELDDLQTVIDWIYRAEDLKEKVNIKSITLIGHSRGGGISIIKAEEDPRITSLVSLASVSDFESRMEALCEPTKWKKEGVTYIKNGRTKQQMPHYFQFFEDFHKNKTRLYIQRAAENLQIPHLIIHGNQDTSVSILESQTIHKWHSNSNFEVIDGANHVFGAQHPWKKDQMPDHLNTVIIKTLNFLNEQQK
ncbi:alpha/beta hydrolase family protein [Aestuariibaculum sediminum]|uniref:Alpha/beta fold hydrolase n=1 Tax=Aestuariibaculum sediminum TaxID=2770637 RepID=A0A8J6Q1N9_9FLAO|nr:alpha/beta fold hydrolase [Aestuariibaculum sediminum]MBD0831146.1 alpha/beta fold hydrolase [Aestuariibaculum sediminum]